MLDAILCPEWQYRCYSFTASWRPARELASMRNASGDEYAIVFSPAGAWVRVLDHEPPTSPWGLESARPWPGVLDTVAAAFQACVQEPAFTLDGVPMVSACLWRQTTDDRWHTGTINFPAGQQDPDGSEWLLDDSPEAHGHSAEGYHELGSVSLAAVREVYALRPLTQPLITALNDQLSVADLADDIAEIGYPTARP